MPLGHGVFLNTFWWKIHPRQFTLASKHWRSSLSSAPFSVHVKRQISLHHPTEYAVDRNIDCGILCDNS